MSLAIAVALVVVGLYATALLYIKCTAGKCKSKRDLTGKTVIVTGANTGIGLETARDVAGRNARVILACRSVARGERAARIILNSTGNKNVLVKQVDVSSLESVRAFAKDILETEVRLDVLVNNAAIALNNAKQRSVDDLELSLATNHFGPFLLTNLLLPLLKKSAPSRIVVVSSLAHEWSRMDFSKMTGKTEFKPTEVYGVTKLANVLFTLGLHERLKGTGVTVNALHPGVVQTELLRNFSFKMKVLLGIVLTPFMKNAKTGAQTSIYAAVSEELDVVSGKYFSDCREKKLKEHAVDPNAINQLWEFSEEITKLNE